MLVNNDKQKQFYEIVHLIKSVQNNVFVSINVEMINLYWNVGQYLNIQLSNAAWGDKTVDKLANFIQRKYSEIKGFNCRGLYQMKQFFETYSSTEFVSLSMAQIQGSDNRSNEIVLLPMTQFKANNPANYIKKIPFIIPTKSVLELISEKTKNIVDLLRTTGKYNESEELEIWKMIDEIYRI